MDQYNQDVNINFQGEDNISGVIDKVNEKVGSLQFKIMALNMGLGAFGKQLFTNTDNLAKFTKVLGTTDVLLNKTFALTGVVKVFSILGTGINDARANLDGFNDGLKAMQASGFDTSIITQFTQLQDAVLGSRGALESFSLTALTTFNRFNQAKSEVATLFPKDDPFITNLSTNIQKLVNGDLKNAVTSIDTLRASYQAASALFIDAADNQSVMVAGLKLAKAGGADTSATMKVLTQTIRAYNLSAGDATKVSAVLNKTIQLGITTMPELANGFAQASVTANAAKIKLEELAGAVAALTLKGFDTPSALTGIESLSRAIITKTPQAAAALRELRDEQGKAIKFDISEIKTKGFTKALQDLNVAAKGNAEVLREILPDATAYNTALALMSNNASQLSDNLEQLEPIVKTGESARKALDEVFNIKLNNQAESFDAIVNRITEQFIQFGEQLAPFFDTGVKALDVFTKTLSGISPEMKQTIASILLGQLAFNKVTDTIGILVGTVTKAFLAYQGLRVTMMFMNGTIGEQVTILKLLWTNNAGLIPILKQLIGIDQSRLLVNAALNKSEYELIATKVANTAATNVNTAAAISNAVTTGKLIEVNGLLGKSYVTNNLLTRVMYADAGKALVTLIAKTKELYVSTIALNRASIASGNLFPTFTAIGTTLTGLGDKIISLFNGASGAIGKLLNGLKLLSAPLIAITLLGAIIHDQFFGTTAQVRKLNEELVKVNNQEKLNLITILNKLEVNKQLEYSEKTRLIRLQTETELAKVKAYEYNSIWTNISESITEGTTNAEKFVDSFISGIPLLGASYDLFKKIVSLPFDLIGKGFNQFRADQILPVLGELDVASEKTQNSIINLTESTQKLKSGFTGFEDIDKLIKAGKILNQTDIDKINNKAQQIAKETENEISANETRIKAVNEQLKNFDALGDKQDEQASEQEKQLDNHRKVLIAANDKLKDELSKKKEIDKARIEYQTQQNILLKRVLDNNLKIEEGSTTTNEDKGSNALQTRMKKGLRLAQTDLEQYRRQVKATLDGTGEYLDANNKKVKIDVTDMTDYVNKFDTTVNGVITSIDQLYQVNGTSATEAAKTLKAVLDTNKNEMNIIDYINGVNQAITYMKDGSKVTIDLLNLEGETRRTMLDSGVTSTRETNAKIRKLNAAKLEEEINNQIKLIEFTKATSGADQKKLDAAKLKLLEQQLAAQQRDNLKAELDERFKQQQVALDREQELIKLDKAKRLISEEEYNNKIAEDTKRNLDLKRKQLLQELELNKNDLEKTKSINNQLLGIDVQQQELITSNLERAINVRSKKRELELTREQALVALNRSKFLTTEEQSIRDIDVVRKKEILNKQLSLNEQLKLVKHDKTKQTEIQNQLLNLQLDYQKIITDNLEREFTKRNKLIENAANRTKLVYRELTNTIYNNVASLNEENKIIDSRNKLTSSTLENESARLTNSLKVTNDIEKRAAIETKIAQLRESNRVVTDAAEQRSLINQQKLIELSLQKQQIELDNRRNDANNNSKLIQLELEKAIKQKRNKEDINAIKIRLDANKQEQLAITKQNELLGVTRRNQSEINSNASRELEIRQRIGREGGLLDLEITKQNEKIARYEKIAQLANLEATIAETNANKMQLAGDLQIKNYQMRLDLLNKQAELEQQHQDNTQRMFKMAEGLAVSDYQKRKLAEQAAKQELLNLDKKHRIERDLLNIQIQMNKLALEKSVLEQKSAELKLAAELKVQEAETAKVLNSRTATDEEKKGSLAMLDAKRFTLTAKQFESTFLDKQRQLAESEEYIQRSALSSKQRNEYQDKTVAVAKSTFTTADDRAIYRALMNNLSGDRRELDNTRINFSNERLQNLFSYSNSNVNLERNNFDSSGGKSKSSNSKLSKDVVINFNPTTNIEVKGSADVKEFSKQLNSESDKWIKGLHETLRKVNTELGN